MLRDTTRLYHAPRRPRQPKDVWPMLPGAGGKDAMADYERLSAMDASFLGIEDGTCHMHVGAVMLFDAAPLRTAAGGVDIDRIRRAVHARLHLVPRFRQRVAYVPWEG